MNWIVIPPTFVSFYIKISLAYRFSQPTPEPPNPYIMPRYSATEEKLEGLTTLTGNQLPTGRNWCGFKIVILIGVIVSVVTYTIGAIVTGITYRHWNTQGKIFYSNESEFYFYSKPLS